MSNEKNSNTHIILSILILNTTAFGQPTQTDLEKLDKMFKDSEARLKVYIDLKIDALDKKLTREINVVKEEIKGVKGSISMLFTFVIALVALIAIAVGLPQILLARQTKQMRSHEEQIEELRREIEGLKQQRIVGS